MLMFSQNIFVFSVRINLPLFSTVLPSDSCCFCPVGLSLFQQVLRVLKLLLSLQHPQDPQDLLKMY